MESLVFMLLWFWVGLAFQENISRIDFLIRNYIFLCEILFKLKKILIDKYTILVSKIWDVLALKKVLLVLKIFKS